MDNHSNSDNKDQEKLKSRNKPKFFSTEFNASRAVLLFCIVVFCFTVLNVILNPTISEAVIEGSAGATQIDLLEELPGLTEDKLNSKEFRENPFGYYINSLMDTAIFLASLLAVLMLTWHGIKYVSSASFSTKESGKEGITDAILGLVLLLSAYILLQTINPNLLKLDIKPKTIELETSGVDVQVDFTTAIRFVSKIAKSNAALSGVYECTSKLYPIKYFNHDETKRCSAGTRGCPDTCTLVSFDKMPNNHPYKCTYIEKDYEVITRSLQTLTTYRADAEQKKAQFGDNPRLCIGKIKLSYSWCH